MLFRLKTGDGIPLYGYADGTGTSAVGYLQRLKAWNRAIYQHSIRRFSIQPSGLTTLPQRNSTPANDACVKVSRAGSLAAS